MIRTPPLTGVKQIECSRFPDSQRNEPFLGIIPAVVPIIDGASPIEIMRPIKPEPALPGVALALGGIEFNSHSLV